MTLTTSPKVLLIGWDAADWKIIHQLADSGKMPNMASFMEEGVIGNLATLSPELSPMLWTSIATGKRPYKHGILGFTEPDPQSGGVRPISNISRRTKAVWNILTQKSIRSAVIGWWPSHPVEQINRIMVSNHYQRAVAPYGNPWPVKPGTIHPERLIGNLAALRIHPQELDVGLIMNFVPRLSEIDQEKDRRIESLAKIIADTATINRAVTAIMHHEPWDFTAVYFDGIDHFSHGFMNYHPPRLSWIQEKDFELYKNVVENGYIYHDMLLGTLLHKAGDDTVIMIVSDHGFHSDHLRPQNIPIEPAGPAVQHRTYGIFAVKGPGIRKDEIIYGASLLDICPTILALFGLPVGEDMDGKPLINIFESLPDIETLPCWDDVEGDDGSHPPDFKINPIEAKEAIQQLVDLGYIEKPDENREKASEDAIRELQYNLARSYIDSGLYTKAISILKELFQKWPDEYRFGILLANSYQTLERYREARSLLEDLFRRKRKNAREAAKELKEFQKTHKEIKFQELERKEQLRLRKLLAEASMSPYAMHYLMGSLLFSEGKKEEALVHLNKAERADSKQPALYNKLGNVYLRMKLWPEAEGSFQKELSIDPESAEANLGLCRVYLGTRKNMKAAEEALQAIGLQYHNPKGHYFLGTALHRMGRIYKAVEALKVAVIQNPNFPEAHKSLSHIYRKRLKDEEMADKHVKLAEEAKKRIKCIKNGEAEPVIDKGKAAKTSLTSSDPRPAEESFIKDDLPFDSDKTIVIVSGLPRSGTSMMMQMLKAGGLQILTDEARRPDEDNPRGYYEDERVKRLGRDSAWLPDARGKAVKIIAHLLSALPHKKDITYRVIFMQRSMDEIVKSQKTMLARLDRKGANLSEEQLKKAFKNQLNRVRRMLAVRRIPTIFVDYGNCLNNSSTAVKEINNFLGGDFNVKKMSEAIEPSMKRQGMGNAII